MADDTPITVTDSALPGQLAAAVRQIILALGGWAIGKGYLDTNTLNAIITIVAVVGPIAWGQWKRYQDHQEKRTMALVVPDAVATVV